MVKTKHQSTVYLVVTESRRTGVCIAKVLACPNATAASDEMMFKVLKYLECNHDVKVSPGVCAVCCCILLLSPAARSPIALT